ncbi:hypothetical protein BDQ12DRAFT_657405 [Crucibulum laeve]|uniref:F-box domain-containing protein n=1 Tax=Crucibulum laeve TaxID=68775 RepID=A0A5C3LPS3_9AGAR|nr:hypothetical protein BDQ12DRAFT_657405 [Crucibulum laeve]
MHALDIPYDVWFNVAQFLPKEEIRNLYGVNRALFMIAMDERYQSAYIRNIREEQTVKCLDRLVHPNLAYRVRSLHLRPSSLGVLLHEHRNQKPSVGWTNALKRLTCAPGPRNGYEAVNTKSSPVEILLQIVGSLSNVTTLHLECADYADNLDWFMYAMPFVMAGWGAFGHILQRLTLEVPVESMREVLPTALRLDNLEELHVKLSVAEPETDTTDIIRTSLVPFINNHHRNLSSFSVSAIEQLDFTALLGDLVYMPRLTKFSVSQLFVSMDQTDTAGLARFLDMHGRNLRDLNVQFYTKKATPAKFPEQTEWFAQPFYSVVLPRIEALSLGLLDFPAWSLHGTTSYISQFRDTLSSLSIKNIKLSYEEVESLITVVAPTPNVKMRHLTLVLRHISPQLFNILSLKLPDLEELSLKFDKIIPREGIPVSSADRAPAFCEEIAKHSYSKWKLARLNLGLISAKEETKGQCRAALATALSSVQSFNGQTREQYVSEGSHSDDPLLLSGCS